MPESFLIKLQKLKLKLKFEIEIETEIIYFQVKNQKFTIKIYQSIIHQNISKYTQAIVYDNS